MIFNLLKLLFVLLLADLYLISQRFKLILQLKNFVRINIRLVLFSCNSDLA